MKMFHIKISKMGFGVTVLASFNCKLSVSIYTFQISLICRVYIRYFRHATIPWFDQSLHMHALCQVCVVRILSDVCCFSYYGFLL
jgi:hypothetical protein